MPMSQCPTPDDLLALSVGKLPNDRVQSLAGHIDECPHCQALLETQQSHDEDVLTACVSNTADTDEFSNDPVYRRLSTVNFWNASRDEPARMRSLPPPPRIIARCEVQRLLGHGGMGVVYRGQHQDLDRDVAIKLLHSNSSETERGKERFRREMKALGRVNHPNIIKAFDAGNVDGTAFLVMEHVEGVDAAQLCRRAGQLSILDACEIIRQAATGLDHAHTQGVIHRDVKPSNLMIGRDGTVRILDLGLAAFSDLVVRPEDDISTRVLMGTIEYMAPEQMSGPHQTDHRADIYSLGVTLYEFLTGHRPWSTRDSQTLLHQIRSMALMDAPPIQSLRADVPDDLARLVHRMLARDPDARDVSMSEVIEALSTHAAAADLGKLAASHATPDDVGTPVTEFAESRTARRRWLPPLAALGGALFVVGLAMFGPAVVPGHTSKTPTKVLSGLQSNIMDVELFSDNRRCAFISWDGALTIQNIESEETISVAPRALNFDGLRDLRLNSLAISRDEELIAVAGSSHRVHLHRARDGAFVTELFYDEPSIMDVCFTSAGDQIIAATATQVSIHSVDGTKLATHEYERHQTRQPRLLAPPNDDFYLLLSANGVEERSLAIGEVRRTFPDTSDVEEITISADGSLVAGVSSLHLSITVWNLRSGEVLHRFPLGSKSVVHRCLRFLSNDLLAVSGPDQTIRIYQIETGDELHCIQADSYCTQRFDVTSDLKRAVSAGGWHVKDRLEVDGDYAIRIWNLPEL